MTRIHIATLAFLAGCFPVVPLGDEPGTDSGGAGVGGGEEGGGEEGGGEEGTGEGGGDTCTVWEDLDQDGYGSGEGVKVDCEQIPGDHVDNDDDCDDGDPGVNPAAQEVCNGLDDDCDGAVDDDDDSVDPSAGTSFHLDVDGDGYGDPDATLLACKEGDGLSTDATDCDDGDATVHPGASESCNGLDDDCDGEVDTESVCPCDLKTNGDHVYLFCEEEVTWVDAEAACADLDNYLLVVVDDATEQSWLAGVAKDYSWWNPWWLGFHNRNATADEEPSGHWEWVDASKGTYTNWDSDWPWPQPDDGDDDEDCAQLDPWDGTWSDTSCDTISWDGGAASYVCESTVP